VILWLLLAMPDLNDFYNPAGSAETSPACGSYKAPFNGQALCPALLVGENVFCF
jgi:hypothetical protein